MEHTITQAILDWQLGSAGAQHKFELVIYDHLRQLASNEKQKMERRHGTEGIQQHVQSTTALVHDVFIKIQQGSREHLANRKEFALLISKTVHNILVDHARKSSASKRQGELTQLENKADIIESNLQHHDQLIDLSQAIHAMAAEFPRQAQTMQLKYFGGFLMKEIADLLNISVSSAEKDLAFAKSWLKMRLAS